MSFLRHHRSIGNPCNGLGTPSLPLLQAAPPQISFQRTTNPRFRLPQIPNAFKDSLSSKILSAHRRNPQNLLSLWDSRHARMLYALMSVLCPHSRCVAAVAGELGETQGKIDVEAAVVAVDDFLNRNPFFVAGLTFIWLVVIPLARSYLSKCKQIAAIDAFRKLRDLKNSQMLDIRRKQSVSFMNPPDLSILNKTAAWVEFSEGDEERFLMQVMENFANPEDTVVCVFDSFDGDSLKVAELLFKNGFKEAYAVKGGLRGKNGWQAIQDKLLPQEVHVSPKKKKKTSKESKENADEKSENGRLPTALEAEQDEKATNNDRPLSPFRNYPDMKPPSSPTPSRPKG